MKIRLLDVWQMGLDDEFENGDVVEVRETEPGVYQFIHAPAYGVLFQWRNRHYWEVAEGAGNGS